MSSLKFLCEFLEARLLTRAWGVNEFPRLRLKGPLCVVRGLYPSAATTIVRTHFTKTLKSVHLPVKQVFIFP